MKSASAISRKGSFYCYEDLARLPFTAHSLRLQAFGITLTSSDMFLNSVNSWKGLNSSYPQILVELPASGLCYHRSTMRVHSATAGSALKCLVRALLEYLRHAKGGAADLEIMTYCRRRCLATSMSAEVNRTAYTLFSSQAPQVSTAKIYHDRSGWPRRGTHRRGADPLTVF